MQIDNFLFWNNKYPFWTFKYLKKILTLWTNPEFSSLLI